MGLFFVGLMGLSFLHGEAHIHKSSSIAAGGFLRCAPQPILRSASNPIRLFHATDPRYVNPDTNKVISYALDVAKSQKSDESYAQGLLILEQCLVSESKEGQEDEAIENAKGMDLLAVSTLLSERGNTDEAIQTLLRIQDLTSCSLSTRVAAIEALVGLNLELGLVSFSDHNVRCNGFFACAETQFLLHPVESYQRLSSCGCVDSVGY